MGKLGEPVTTVEEAPLANTAWHTDRLDDDEGADLHHSAGHNPDPGSIEQRAPCPLTVDVRDAVKEVDSGRSSSALL